MTDAARQVDDEPSRPPSQTFIRPTNWRNPLGGHRLAKVIRRDPQSGEIESKAPSKEEFPNTFQAKSEIVPEDPIERVEFYRQADQDGWIPIHGALSPKYNGRSMRRAEFNASFVLDEAHWYLNLDVENLPVWREDGRLIDLRTVDPLAIVEHVRQQIRGVSPEIANASGVACLSGSFALFENEGPRLHMILRLSRALTASERRALCGEIGAVESRGAKLKIGIVDLSVLTPTQLYFGPPVCDEGLDPLNGRDRWFWAPGVAEAVEVPSDVELARRTARLIQRELDMKGLASASLRGDARIGPRIDREGRGGVLELSARDWGGAWTAYLWACENAEGLELWPALQSATGAFIAKHGQKDGAKEFFCDFVDAWLDKTIRRYRKPARIKSARDEVPIGYAKIFSLDEWRRVPREEPTTAGTEYSLGEGEAVAATERNFVLLETIKSVRREARWKVAQQIAFAAYAQINKLHAEANSLVAQARNAGALLPSETKNLRDQAIDLEKRLVKYGRRTKVIVDADPSMNLGIDWAFAEEPPFPRGLGDRVWKYELGLGKTHDAALIAAELARSKIIRGSDATMRVAYCAGTGALCEEFGERVQAPVAHWRGENRSIPRRTETACPIADQRTAIRLAGGDAKARCGSRKVGYCDRHRAVSKDPCVYTLQEKTVKGAAIVTFAGAVTLGAPPVEYVRREKITVKRFNPLLRKSLKLAVPMPDFDLIFLDDAPLSQLEHIEVDATRGARAVIERTIEELETLAKGPGELLERYGRVKDGETLEEIETRRSKAWTPIREIILRIADQARETSEGAFLTYGQLYEIIGRDVAIPADKIGKLRKDVWSLKLEMPVATDADVREFLKTPDGRALKAWNGGVLWAARALEGLAAALRRHENAPDDDRTGYFLAKSIFQKRDDKDAIVRAHGVAVRSVEKINDQWSPNKSTRVIMDASFRPEVAEAYGLRPDAIVAIPVRPSEGVADITVCRDRVWSYSWMREAVKAARVAANAPEKRNIRGRKKGESLRSIARWVEINIAQAGKRGGLLICPQELESALVDYWKTRGGTPSGLFLAHFNAVRGIDAWKNCAWLGVVSRPLAPVAAFASQHALLDGLPHPVLVQQEKFDRDLGRYRQADNPDLDWTLRDAQPRIDCDPLAEALRAAGCDDEMAQVIGRMRLIRRTANNPVRIDILTNHPIPGLRVNRMTSADEMMAAARDPRWIAWAKGLRIDRSAKGGLQLLAAASGISADVVKHLLEESNLPDPPSWPDRAVGSAVKIRLPGARYALSVPTWAKSPEEAVRLARSVFIDETVEIEFSKEKVARGRPRRGKNQ